MNRIDQTFAKLKSISKAALLPFLTIGDPNLATSVKIIHELEAAGADIIELGVPYSDPLADGPVIQESSQRALLNKITIMDCIQVAKTCREEGSQLPFILFTYYNPVLQVGLEKFFKIISENEISGLIIPDLPVEENGEVLALAQQHNIHLIPLVAPTSNDRIAKIVNSASGFIYCVSSLGVTGTRAQFHTGINEFIELVKRSSYLPVVVGFGISNSEQVARFSQICDGVVVGSALVRKISECIPQLQSTNEAEQKAGLLQIREFVRELNSY
ncbi:tryptophan synthase subunit alpha [Paenibacillus psychroresistens]|uniref:Tryptophan synthase alpha chain n=1 Tax=Paenibacillus psychroresistens TaxID=1778678 RepID=A0A6B8RMF6_9BACL|nr:tryptophan synthase subunit alpha [Paenibacillus psychroresistens]QGQ96862.1 tryptophan synthase subunit alpha [Paenibacillus psychroresistens]